MFEDTGFDAVSISPDETGMQFPVLRAQAQGGSSEPVYDDGVAEQVSEPELAEPPMYQVVLLNDDYTPMEFVVEVLQTFFSMDQEKAVQIMLAVHTQGKATCGIFTRDVAETKAHLVNEYARECQHPLLCDVDPVE